MQMARGTRVTTALVAVNGVLALILWWQLGGASPEVQLTAAPVPRPALPLSFPEGLPTLPPFTTYQELLERPLFWSERRVLAEATALAAESPAVALPFILLGVVQAAEAHALLGKSGSREITRIHIGDVVEGWSIEAMTADSVTLVANGLRRELRLGNGK